MNWLHRSTISCVLGCLLVAGPLNGQDTSDNGQGPGTDLRQPLQQLGQLMERDWDDRPEWAQMAASLLKGEPMGMGKGWYKPGESRYSLDWLLQTFDADKSGSVDQGELADGAKYMAALDRNTDGNLSAVDFAPRALFNRNDPPSMMGMVLFRFLDSDSNGKITPDEMSLFFLSVDKERTGFLTVTDLQALFRRAPQELAPPSNLPAEYEPGVNPLHDLDMLMSGQLGSLESGPLPNEVAPDFTLRRQDGTGSVTLSQLRGKPVVLIFGSFT